MYAGHTPRFVKRYSEIAQDLGDAVARYAHGVRSGEFPEEQHTYAISADELAAFETSLR
jgi:3-methyl-2-oxobutanoate hydroxymethyltransferase